MTPVVQAERLRRGLLIGNESTKTPSKLNMRPKVCLFTAHSPSGGGGGAILRSLVPLLSADFDIEWRYLSPLPDEMLPDGWLGKPLMGEGNPLRDFFETAGMLIGSKTGRWSEIVAAMLLADCDAYWIVSHNEGLPLARFLTQGTDRPVHLTVHDDWAGALCARSQRYLFLSPIAARLSDNVLRSVNSVDVVSEGMQSHYFGRTGIKAEVVHRCIGEAKFTERKKDSSQVRVGHLGSVYSKSDLRVFVNALMSYAKAVGVGAQVVFWGANLRSGELEDDLASFVDLRPHSDEAGIIDALQDCDCAYAAYPFSRRLQLFAQTSLPTKLSTYVAARRPIFGHAPRESTLSDFLVKTGVGKVWDNLSIQHGLDSIRDVLAMRPDARLWNWATGEFFGKKNVEAMAKLLRKAVSMSRK